MTQQYVYRVARVERVVDGDSYWLHLDTGFRNTLLVNVRLLGYDCPEARQGSLFERRQGASATRHASGWLSDDDLAPPVWCRTEKDPDSFGRWLGALWIEDESGEHHLGDYLLSLGLATTWPTRWHEIHDPGRDKA